VSSRAAATEWRASYTLNDIRRTAPELLSRVAALPEMVTARQLGRFLNCSHMTVLEWIRSGNLVARKRRNRWLISRNQIEALIEAAQGVERYYPKARRPFRKLNRRRRKIRLPNQRTFKVSEVVKIFQCSRTTVFMAIEGAVLLADQNGSGRWRIQRNFLLASPVFGRLIDWAPPARVFRSVRLPQKELFSTAEVANRCRVSQQTVRNWIEQGKLVGHVPLKRKLFIPRKALLTFLQKTS
jgi:excisionase family DNA binding protein